LAKVDALAVAVAMVILQRFFAFSVAFSEVLYGPTQEINLLESAVRLQ
jgi:hypothetical protein